MRLDYLLADPIMFPIFVPYVGRLASVRQSADPTSQMTERQLVAMRLRHANLGDPRRNPKAFALILQCIGHNVCLNPYED